MMETCSAKRLTHLDEVRQRTLEGNFRVPSIYTLLKLEEPQFHLAWSTLTAPKPSRRFDSSHVS